MTPFKKITLPWAAESESFKLIKLLESNSYKALYVGGCVRDALWSKSPKDLDLATDAPIKTVITLSKEANFKTIPTGLKHGTATIIINNKPFEITQLRHDVKTDGRHAEVKFTDNWKEDAKRRDLTINAFYADSKGQIYDPLNNYQDIENHNLRFIGTAINRIEEDRLRLLRYFRFYAQFNIKKPDEEAIKAAKLYSNKLNNLSGERIQTEILKLLSTSNPLPAWQLMQKTGIIKNLIPWLNDDKALARIIKHQSNPKAPQKTPITTPLLPLTALINTQNDTNKLTKRLRLSNKQAKIIQQMQEPLIKDNIKLNLYKYGKETTLNQSLIGISKGKISRKTLEKIQEISKNWQAPTFPLTGKDLIKNGIKPSPKLGKILTKTESWWCKNNFKPNKKDCLNYSESISC